MRWGNTEEGSVPVTGNLPCGLGGQGLAGGEPYGAGRVWNSEGETVCPGAQRGSSEGVPWLNDVSPRGEGDKRGSTARQRRACYKNHVTRFASPFKSLRQAVSQTFTKNLWCTGQCAQCPGDSDKQGQRGVCTALLEGWLVGEDKRTQKVLLSEQGGPVGHRWGCPAAPGDRNRMAWLEGTPKLDLKELSGVSQASEAKVEVICAEKGAQGRTEIFEHCRHRQQDGTCVHQMLHLWRSTPSMLGQQWGQFMRCLSCLA